MQGDAGAKKKKANRRNCRRGDLHAIRRYYHGPGPLADPEMTLEKLAAEIADDYDGRDPLDPEVVTPVEIGLLYNVTFDVRLDIERAETEFRIRTYGKPKNYLFRLRTVIAVDITAEAQAKQYAKLASRLATANGHGASAKALWH